MSASVDFEGLVCPLPLDDYPRVLLAHGGGGTLMHRLISTLFAEVFASEELETEHDAARLTIDGGRIAFTTDSFVVSPLEFPGGDIGSLAVHGTVNDLAMGGARPLYLSCGFILEEGLDMERLWRLALSMRRAADEAGVRIVTGDTKVVERGKGDGLYINTSGIGIIEHEREISPQAIEQGDLLIINGDLGRHGMTIMAAREGLGFSSGELVSDSASLGHLTAALLDAGLEVHCLRDLTRGGLASAANELASAAGHAIEIEQQAVPVCGPVASLSEVLGLDPLHVANEGRFVAIVAPDDAERAVKILRGLPHGEGAAIVGRVGDADRHGRVTLRSPYGASRILTMLSGEQLPRIC